MLSLYIHIPFCHHKCGYCSFNVIPLQTLSRHPEGSEADSKDPVDKQDVSPSRGFPLLTSLHSAQHNAHSPIITTYLAALHRQIDEMKEKLGDQEIRTIYFGGGTPSTIGSEEMSNIIDHIAAVRNLEYLEELSIEINPEPVDQMLDLISTISNQYKHFHRVRFSIGIQSFDNEVLEESGRQYNFQSCVDFLRKLTHIKMEHNVFNFDFIAFGKFNKTRKGDLQLRDAVRLDFFQRFVESGFADSFSLYTLELFEGSAWFNEQIAKHNHEKAGFGLKKYGSDDDVYEEFELLKSILLDAGYQRYEISNYSKSGSNSIHNRVYRAMDERLGLGTGATSHLKKENVEKILQGNSVILNEAQRSDQRKSSGGGSILSKEDNTQTRSFVPQDDATSIIYSGHISIVPDLKRFVAGHWIDDKKTELLTEREYLKEKFLMGMRTMDGLQLINNTETTEVKLQTLKDRKIKPAYHHKTQGHDELITTILVDDRQTKVAVFVEEELCTYNAGKLKLTDQGMDVYNSIITELMQ